LKIAYCADCKAVIAIGSLPETVLVKGKPTPYHYRHTHKGSTHTATLMEVADEPRGQGEALDHYFKRIAKAI
jgi:hypothetical protein